MAADRPEKPEGVRPSALANVARWRELVTLLIVLAVIVFFHARTLPSPPGDPTPSVFVGRTGDAGRIAERCHGLRYTCLDDAGVGSATRGSYR